MTDIDRLNNLKRKLIALQGKWQSCLRRTNRERDRYEKLGYRYMRLSAQFDELNWKLQVGV